MRFLVDRCAGRRLAQWLRDIGHDVVDAQEVGPDPGDQALLEQAAKDKRVLVTIDSDFGELIHLHDMPHSGLVRLPDVPASQRIGLMQQVLDKHETALEAGAIVTVGRGRLRISRR
ncbi:MAG: hypothetical protein A2289_20375 [Deltaproteobacteria bacterium RIFOXYA12_FULL_58_15]|nr:MAG: hypothetical protein A2289_20375 [Deltaproteobacteria bacterium RIFOXYA12_FULL_58_15]OGR14374.1 MAG: hypothetical protein A2341_25605 [Deltaproteobacteria bacterium RIFOXYB12_FULL_58_9]